MAKSMPILGKKRRREDEHLELQRVMLSALAAHDYTEMRNILMEASKKFEESNKEVVSFSCKALHDEHFGEKGLDLKMDLVGPPIIESFLLSPCRCRGRGAAGTGTGAP